MSAPPGPGRRFLGQRWGRWAVTGAIGGSLAGCGAPPPATGFDGGPVLRTLSAQQVIAYEGMPRFVTVIDGDGDTDLTGATIEPIDSASALVVRESLCTPAACAVQLEILDLTPSRAVPIPRPIDARNDFLRVRLADGDERQVLITVWPLDTISGSGSPAPVRGAIFASSASSLVGGTFVGSPRDPEPLRWLVMGDVALAGDLDVAGTAAGAIGGGEAGGAVGEDAGGGAGGAASGGGGGGGPGGAGEAGAGATGGTGGAPSDPSCVADFTTTRCGGAGGGGGSDGAGGAGAGTILIASLGAVSISGSIHAAGAPGADGVGAGGGGGGGDVLITGASVSVPGSIDVAGGQGGRSTGDGQGGAGGSGRARIADPAGEPSVDGVVAFDVLGSDLIVSVADYVVRGVATPGASVEVTAIDRVGITGEAVAGADGSFVIPVTLEPGVNRLRLTTDTVRAWNGTSFELVRVDGAAMPQPMGGVLDVAYVPTT